MARTVALFEEEDVKLSSSGYTNIPPLGQSPGDTMYEAWYKKRICVAPTARKKQQSGHSAYSFSLLTMRLHLLNPKAIVAILASTTVVTARAVTVPDGLANRGRVPPGIYLLLYQNINYDLPGEAIADLNTCINLGSSANDKVSSFEILTTRCWFYLDTNCIGISYNTPNNNPDLRPVGFNDNISSVRCI
ncbi:hypothetical protein HGRIS_001783 [Hohenbuehelia grisea]|uniref:Uncharacterized protein n=1 Tax=Hohenbuehelia grisea TaxID=104357 RepID=A0ABR3JIK1_9AGAR